MRPDEWRRYVDQRVKDASRKKETTRPQPGASKNAPPQKKNQPPVQTRDVKEVLLGNSSAPPAENVDSPKPLPVFPQVTPLELLKQKDRKTIPVHPKRMEYVHEVSDPMTVLMQRDKTIARTPPHRGEPAPGEIQEEELPLGLLTIEEMAVDREILRRREELIRRLTDPLVTPEEASLILCVSKNTLLRYAKRNLLHPIKTAGGQTRFRFSELLSFIQQSTKSESR